MYNKLSSNKCCGYYLNRQILTHITSKMKLKIDIKLQGIDYVEKSWNKKLKGNLKGLYKLFFKSNNLLL